MMPPTMAPAMAPTPKMGAPATAPATAPPAAPARTLVLSELVPVWSRMALASPWTVIPAMAPVPTAPATVPTAGRRAAPHGCPTRGRGLAARRPGAAVVPVVWPPKSWRSAKQVGRGAPRCPPAPLVTPTGMRILDTSARAAISVKVRRKDPDGRQRLFPDVFQFGRAIREALGKVKEDIADLVRDLLLEALEVLSRLLFLLEPLRCRVFLDG